MGDRLIRVTVPTDEHGLVGRRCPSSDCGQYFKLKPGTGLSIEDCGCPYCGTRAEAAGFSTPDQIEYAKRVAVREVVGPILEGFKRDVEALNKPSRDSLISIKFSVHLPTFSLHQYREADVETAVICSNCSLEFAVFGIFASCPDCGLLNAFDVFHASLDVCRRRLHLVDLPDTASDAELVKAILVDSLGSAVAAFDALGKKLRQHRPDTLPTKPRNLFQNVGALDKALATGTSKSIAVRLDTEAFHDLVRLFQVRHIYEHNLGVVDDDFVARVPSCAHLKGRLYPLSKDDVERLVELLDQLASSLREDFGSGASP